jgi:hypothetical protein
MSEHNEEQEANVSDEIFGTIIQLNKERLDLEREQKFFEAGRIKDQLKRLGEEYVKVYLYSLKEKQRTEKEGLEAEYEKELEELAQVWDEKLGTNEEELRNFLEGTQERHREEIGQFENDLKQNIPQQGRFSPEILNLEYQIEMLVKDQRYNEAGNLQKRLDVLKNDCINKINNKTEEKIKNLLENMSKRHENELIAIEKRLNSDREELLKAREKEFEKVHSKFRVFREKLDNNHNGDFIKEEKRLRTFKPSSNNLANLA